MRDALATEGAGLDMVVDESLAQGDHRFLDAASHGDILRVGALIGLLGLLEGFFFLSQSLLQCIKRFLVVSDFGEEFL